MVGDSGTGKTSLLVRFIDNTFNETFVKTVGIDFKSKIFQVEGKSFKLQIWDTAGDEGFRSIASSYYSGVQAIIIVFDLSSKESYNNISNYLQDISRFSDRRALKMLIGNKRDEIERQVDYRTATDFAESMDMVYFETSAKTNWNVEKLFHTISSEIRAANEE